MHDPKLRPAARHGASRRWCCGAEADRRRASDYGPQLCRRRFGGELGGVIERGPFPAYGTAGALAAELWILSQGHQAARDASPHLPGHWSHESLPIHGSPIPSVERTTTGTRARVNLRTRKSIRGAGELFTAIR